MNVYDFDNTILKGDSSILFYFYSYKKHPFLMIWYLFKTIWWGILYIFKIMDFKTLKENMYSYVCEIDDLDEMLQEFWNKNVSRIKKFYLDNQKEDDVIISASFDFILIPICNKLNISNLICTKYNLKTGKIIGNNVKDFEKVKLFKKIFNNKKMFNAYSDSGSDLPMLEYADNGYVVRNEELIPLNDYKFKRKYIKKYSRVRK